jgi:hypothetical protein
MTLEIQFMNLNDLLLTRTGRNHTDMIASMIGNDPGIFTQLLNVVIANTEPQSRKALWVIDTYSERVPEVITPEVISTLTRALPVACHTAIHRHILRIFSRTALPDEVLGDLITICFDFLLAPGEPVAVKAHAMEILFRISKDVPEIKKELADSIEWKLTEESPGFRARAAKILKQLY